MFVLFVYFLYRVLFLFRLIIYYSFYLFFNYFVLRRKFNINYLHIPNIVAVELSQSFNVMIHFINYLCLNWLILVFSGFIWFITLLIYVLRAGVRLRVIIRKSFLISYFFLNYFYLTFVVLKVTKFFSFLVQKKFKILTLFIL